MHSEHLQNVRPVRVISGWLVAIAVTSLIMLVFTATGITERTTDMLPWSPVSVAVGFFVGGMFAGMRALQAPVLHGIFIGLTSLVAWVVANVIAYGIGRASDWETVGMDVALMLLLVQIIAAIIGALIGYNIALRGKPGLSEHEPI